MPKVSVVLPNYNGEKYLSEAIDSVLNQTFTDLELIIVDDASTDHSKEIIEGYLDPRIRFICGTVNRHAVYTENIGLSAAKGEYIARIDSDDIWAPDKLDKQVKFLEENPSYGACFSKIRLIDDKSRDASDVFSDIADMFNSVRNRSQEEWIRYYFYYGNRLCSSSVLIRTSSLKSVGMHYRLAFMPGEDYELWSRIVLKYPIIVLNEPLVCYRWTLEDGKISHTERNGLNPIKNIEMMLRDMYLDEMDNETFIRSFHADFHKEGPWTDKDIIIEKAFLLLDCARKSTGNINFLAFRRFMELLDEPGTLAILEEEYHFDLKEYYKNYYVKNFYDYQAEIDAGKTSELIEELKKQCTRYEELTRNQGTELLKKERELGEMTKIVSEYDRELKQIREKLFLLKDELAAIQNSILWKSTVPVRSLLDKLREMIKR